MVGPAQAEGVLAALLELRGTVAAGPIAAFGREEQIRGTAGPQIGDGGADQLASLCEALCDVLEASPPPRERLLVVENRPDLPRHEFRRLPTAVTMTLDHPEFEVAIRDDTGLAESCQRLAFDLRAVRSKPWAARKSATDSTRTASRHVARGWVTTCGNSPAGMLPDNVLGLRRMARSPFAPAAIPEERWPARRRGRPSRSGECPSVGAKGP